MENKILEVSDLSAGYGSKEIIANVNFSINEGDIYGIIGPNGAGKTTIINAIEGLLKPMHGKVVIDGIDIQKDTINAKRKLGVLMQTSHFPKELRLKDILTLYISLYDVVFSYLDKKDFFENTNLLDKQNEKYEFLSGGQKQIFALALALIHSPKLLILDEPTTGLDPYMRKNIWDYIIKLRDSGSSVLLVSHYMEEVKSYCDQMSIIYQGKIIQSGTPDSVIKEYQEKHFDILKSEKIGLDEIFISLSKNKKYA
jgi:ABC-2 type transport system ATP-binding protein